MSNIASLATPGQVNSQAAGTPFLNGQGAVFGDRRGKLFLARKGEGGNATATDSASEAATGIFLV
jgi:hypothetical protein